MHAFQMDIPLIKKYFEAWSWG